MQAMFFNKRVDIGLDVFRQAKTLDEPTEYPGETPDIVSYYDKIDIETSGCTNARGIGKLIDAFHRQQIADHGNLEPVAGQ